MSLRLICVAVPKIMFGLLLEMMVLLPFTEKAVLDEEKKRAGTRTPTHTHTHTYLHTYLWYCMTELKSYGVPMLLVCSI